MKKIWISFLFILSVSVFAVTAKPISLKKGMVVSEQKLASQVGADILRQGGNAVDAAVAVGYALAVVNPCCGNIGGGGFMTIHLATGKNIFLNFREKAPLRAKPTMFLDAAGHVIPNKSLQGYLAVGVPGTVLGLDTALKKYGTMTRKQVMQPAIQLAQQGYTLTAYDIQLFKTAEHDFQQQPNVAAIFLKNNKLYHVGDKLIQTDLSRTLKLIAEKGPAVFYQGVIAKNIVKASEAHEGILTLDDFARYKIEIMQPIECTYRGFTILSAPPPSSGGVTLCETLNILEGYPLQQLGYHSLQSIHHTVEAMRYAFADRNNKLGDPDFIQNPVATLLAKNYAEKIRKKIHPSRATPSSEVSTDASLPEGVHTTHYSVIDKNGNAVAVTSTLNSYFGAQVIAGDTGFFLNNEMDDFAINPGQPNQFGLVQSAANNIQPGKRPLSSMAPTIVLKDKHLFMVLGSPGGPRIITATLQTILNVIDYKMPIQQAVDAPRFHHQWLPDQIDAEPRAFSLDLIKKLQAMQYHINVMDKTWGGVEAILVDARDGTLQGGSDYRRPLGEAVRE